LRLVISIDVEEEGLFSGRYPRTPPGVENVRELRRLEFITSEFGFPLTLLTTYRVAVSPPCQEILLYFRDLFRAEIGAHLHHWSTPPFEVLPYCEPIRSDLLPPPLLEAKFETLLASLRDNLGVVPQVFRMGRFDIGEVVFNLLPKFGLNVDSSVVPLQRISGGPDHFLAPADPFRRLPDPLRPGNWILEVPLTIVPLVRTSPQLIHQLASNISERNRNAVFTGFRYIASVGIHPAWFPLQSMKLAVRLHRSRRGRVLNMFLHSSELKPGASPSFTTEGAVNSLVDKIRKFLSWLVRTGPVEGVTLGQLYARESWGKSNFCEEFKKNTDTG
jgi:hypothetical protein